MNTTIQLNSEPGWGNRSLKKNENRTFTNKTILPIGAMNAINDLIKISKTFSAKLILNSTPEGKFYLIIENVWLRDGYMHKPIQGIGTTIEDAAHDYLRLCRGCPLYHIITNQEYVPY